MILFWGGDETTCVGYSKGYFVLGAMLNFGVGSQNNVGILKKVWKPERKNSGKHALKWEIKRAYFF